MQKTKRKNVESDSSPAKKKKVQFAKTENDDGGVKIGKTKKDGSNGKRSLQKDKIHAKGKPSFNKGKPAFSKGKAKFEKGSKNKDPKSTEKPVWSELKKEKKELRVIRRKAKATNEVFEISHKAKLLSAQIQRKVVKSDFRDNACKELHTMLKGQYKSIALSHDLSRVIQVLLKHSAEEIRNEITMELLDIMVQMVQSKYAHHAVKRILKYGSDSIRHSVIKQFYGHIVTLAAHTISAPVLDYAYGEFASQSEKQHMQQEFYGEIYKNTKDNSVKTLSDAYKGSPEMKGAILSSCKANVQRILDKNLHDSELLHSVLYDYIRECSAEERVELITTLSPLIVPLSNSLPGVNTASICVWQGTNKDKKSILKVVKEHAVSLSKHKTGYRLLLAIFDSVDDTVLVKKAIVSTLVANIKDIVQDHWGKMTLHWLVKPNDTAAFHPSFLKFLKEGMNSGTSKKDAEIRVTELREAILPTLLKEIEENAEFWMSDPTIALLTTAILSISSTVDIQKALSKAVCRPDWHITKDGKEVLAIEDAGMHMCLKKLASLDKERPETSLGEHIAEDVNVDTLKSWLPTNRGCFFLVKLIESNQGNVVKKLQGKIKSASNILKQQKTPGAKLLLEKVK